MFRNLGSVSIQNAPWRPLIMAAVLSVVALVGLFGFFPEAARAGLTWCAGDPELDIEGQRVNITVFVPADSLTDVSGDVIVEVTVPRGVDVDVMFVDSTYFRERVVIERTYEPWRGGEDLDVGVRAYVPGRGQPFPVAMTIEAPGAADGDVFQWIDGMSRSWMAGNVTLSFEDDD